MKLLRKIGAGLSSLGRRLKQPKDKRAYRRILKKISHEVTQEIGAGLSSLGRGLKQPKDKPASGRILKIISHGVTQEIGAGLSSLGTGSRSPKDKPAVRTLVDLCPYQFLCFGIDDQYSFVCIIQLFDQ